MLAIRAGSFSIDATPETFLKPVCPSAAEVRKPFKNVWTGEAEHEILSIICPALGSAVLGVLEELSCVE
jgi:hypothetical protein